jgi:cytidylate kinase
MKLNIITIDGPSASGKGSLSRNLAKYLDFNILIAACFTEFMLIYLVLVVITMK